MATNPNGKLIRLPIVQTTGDSKKHVMSQDAATKALNGKVNKTITVNGQPLTKSINITIADMDTPSKAVTNAALTKKLDKASITDAIGDSKDLVMSQYGVSIAVENSERNITYQIETLSETQTLIEGQIESLSNSKANATDVYTKAEVEKKFITKSDVRLLSWKDKVDLTKNGDGSFSYKGESLLGRTVWVRFLSQNNKIAVSGILPPLTGMILVLNGLDSSGNVVGYKLEMSSDGKSLTSDTSIDQISVSKI